MATKKTQPSAFQAWYDYSEMAYKWRGEVINKSINLEQVVETFIARHFIFAKTEEQYSSQLVLFKQMFFFEGGVLFGKKISMAKRLISQYHAAYFINPTFDIEENALNDLQEILEFRNNMAHWELDFSREYRWNGFKNRTMKINHLPKGKEKIITQNEITRIVGLCNKYTTIFLHWTHYPFDKIYSE